VNLEAQPTMLTQIVVAKLTKMLGEAQAQQLADEVLRKLGTSQLQNADQMKQLADELISRGGLTRMIGHSIMVDALLRGAKH
jgi:hypothetical protein